MEPKQTKGLNRNTIDKYYTKDSVAELCLNLVRKYIQINPDDLIIEPSAGNGSFITGIKSLTSNFKFYAQAITQFSSEAHQMEQSLRVQMLM